MSHFYGKLQGNRGEATRCGTKDSGLGVTAASWAGAIRVDLYVDGHGRDCFRIAETPWYGQGRSRVIAEGVLGKDESDERRQSLSNACSHCGSENITVTEQDEACCHDCGGEWRVS